MIIRAIIKSLQKYDEIGINNLGLFRKENYPSEIQDGKILPPKVLVGFTYDNDVSGFAFVMALSTNAQIRLVDADSKVNEWVDNLLNAVDHNKSVTFENFGTFSKDKNGKIVFESEIVKELNVEYEGMKSMTLQPSADKSSEDLVGSESSSIDNTREKVIPSTSDLSQESVVFEEPTPEVKEPELIEEPIAEMEPTPEVEEPELIEEPVVEIEPTPEVNEPEPIEEPITVSEPTPEVKEPELIEEPVVEIEPTPEVKEPEPIEEPITVTEPTPEVKEPELIEEPVVEIESTPEVEQKPVSESIVESISSEQETISDFDSQYEKSTIIETNVDNVSSDIDDKSNLEVEENHVIEDEQNDYQDTDSQNDVSEYVSEIKKPKGRKSFWGILIFIIVIIGALVLLVLLFKDELKPYYERCFSKKNAVDTTVVDSDKIANTDELIDSETVFVDTLDNEAQTEVDLPTENTDEGNYLNSLSNGNYVTFEKGKFYVIVGSFKKETDAIKHIRDKKLEQYNAKLLRQPGNNNIRVCTGVFASEPLANEFAQKINIPFWLLK